MNLLITNIQWEKDGHDVQLPTCVIVTDFPEESWNEEENDTYGDEEIDWISDKLTEYFGFVYTGYQYEKIEDDFGMLPDGAGYLVWFN